MVRPVLALILGGTAIAGGVFVARRIKAANEGAEGEDSLIDTGAGFEPYYGGDFDPADPWTGQDGGTLGYDPFALPLAGDYQGADESTLTDPTYIDQGTYNVTIPMDEETSRQVLDIQRQQAREAKRQGQIQTAAVAGGTALFLGRPLKAGWQAAKNLGARAAAPFRGSTSQLSSAWRTPRTSAGRFAPRTATARAASIARTPVARAAGTTVAVAAATPTVVSAGRTVVAGFKGDRGEVREQSATTVARGTEFLSLGAARIDPRGEVRLFGKDFEVEAPSSLKQAGSNFRKNVKTIFA